MAEGCSPNQYTTFQPTRSSSGVSTLEWTRKAIFSRKSCVLPKRLESRLDFVPWASSFTFLTQANKAKVLYGIPRDPDVAAALAELEEEENEGNAEDEKPKVGCDCDLTVTCMILHLKVMW